jgi:RHS repeat-associated protein
MDFHTFGELVQDSNPGWQPFGFAGGLYDADSGLVRFGYRDYDSATSRWLTKDPTGFEAHQTNLYQYVHGDPVNGIDPTGLICEGLWERARGNFKITNDLIPGVATPTGLTIVLVAGRTVARSFAIPTVTFGQWVLSGFRGAVMGAATFSAVETGIVAVATAAYTAVLVGTVYEAGVLIGSVGEAAYAQCLRSCQ